MKVWIIEPHDPLIFRDGKPFGPTPGVRATSLPFPFPSTTTGGVRTQVGLDEQGMFTLTSTDELKQLKKLAVRGPLLVQLTPEGTIEQWLLPAPADAVLFSIEKTSNAEQSNNEENTTKDTTCKVERLLPLNPTKHAMTDLDTQRPGLALVGFKEANLAKPAKEAPLYWYWDNFKKWLETPATFFTEPAQLGLRGLPREIRTHVAMDSETRTGKDGALFDTSGMEFTGVDKERNLSQTQRLALAVITDDPREIRQTLGSFGGERRIVSWRKNENNNAIRCCPEEIQKRIICEGACRLILLTPAYFEQGYYPTWLLEEHAEIKPQLKAIAIQRPQVVSGWDIAQHSPKPARRLAPAGTVLFLEFKSNENEETIKRWIQQTWLHCISDDDTGNNDNPDQFRLDGFGLAILGTSERVD